VKDGQVKLDFQLQKSSNLSEWGSAGGKVEWSLPVEDASRLFRLQIGEPAPAE